MFGFNPLAFDLLNATRKRRALGLPDDTVDLNIPNSLPVPNNAQPYAPPGRSRGDILSNIIGALASGVAVGISDNPSQTLQQQLMQQREENMRKQQLAFENLRQERSIQAQKELQQQQDTAQETRQQKEYAFRKTEREAENLFKSKESETDFQRGLTKQQIDINARTDLAKLSQQFDLDKIQKEGDIRKLLQDKQLEGQASRENAQLFATLLHYGKGINPVGIVGIVSKIQDGVPLDANDNKIVKQAQANFQAMNQKQGGAGQGEKFQFKSMAQAENDRNELIKALVTKATEPRINPQTGMPMVDFTGKPISTYASADEIAKRVADGVKIFDSVQPDHIKAAYQGKQTQQGVQNVGVDPVISTVDNLIKQGQKPQQIDVAIDSSSMSVDDKKKAKARLKNHFKILQ